MLYQQAVELLMSGKYVSRGAWDAEGSYLAHLPGIIHFLKVTIQPKPVVTPYAADIVDSTADDWKLVENVALPVQQADLA